MPSVFAQIRKTKKHPVADRPTYQAVVGGSTVVPLTRIPLELEVDSWTKSRGEAMATETETSADQFKMSTWLKSKWSSADKFKRFWSVSLGFSLLMLIILVPFAAEIHDPIGPILWGISFWPWVAFGVYGTMKALRQEREKLAVLEEKQSQFQAVQQELSDTDTNAALRLKRETAEIERQTAVKDFALSEHFQPFITKLKEAELDDISGTDHARFVALYHALEEAFRRNNSVSLKKLVTIPDDVSRVDQMEALIDLYAEKITRVRRDDSIDDEDRETKIANWERLMERDIAKLEEA